MHPTQIRTHAFRKAHENIDSTLKAVESVLTQLDVSRQVENKVLEGLENDLGGFLEVVDQLQHNVEFFTLNRSLKGSDGALDHARYFLNKGMSCLADEFKALLTQHSKPADTARLLEVMPSSSGKHGSNPPGEGRTDVFNGDAKGSFELPVLIAPRVVTQLREMFERLVAAGYHARCLKIYGDVRSSTLQQSLRKLGFERLSEEDVQKMQQEALEGKIVSWNQYIRIAVKLLLGGERKLCDQIWYHLHPHREKCFADVTDSSLQIERFLVHIRGQQHLLPLFVSFG